MNGRRYFLPIALLALLAARPALGQTVRYGSPVPATVRALYDRGLAYLQGVQQDGGSWGSCGSTSICLMSFLACGEDPNFGRYAETVRKAVRYLISQQNGETGYIGGSMYEHGFAMLALAESYGAVDDGLLWEAHGKGRTIGQAVELAVRCAITSQNQNPFHAWRYSPTGKDADTSVSGAVLMGLLAARNAGIQVPDKSIDQAIGYYTSMTSPSGTVGYSGIGMFGDSLNRSAIAALVCAVAKRKDLKTFKATIDYLKDNSEVESNHYPYYFRYYMAQALFQGDHELWKHWTQENTERALSLQNDDGSIGTQGAGGGKEYTTGMMLLSLGLDYCLLPIYER